MHRQSCHELKTVKDFGYAPAGAPGFASGALEGPPGTNISKKRILVVEDAALIAVDLSEMLNEAGLEVVRPAGIVAEALRLVSTEGCDAAILDVNLGGGTSAPIGRELRERVHLPRALRIYANHPSKS